MELNVELVVAAALVLHGLGHTGGYWMLGSSWVFTRFLGSRNARILGGALWAVAIVGFVGAGLAILGMLGNPGLWRTLTAVSAGLSLTVIALFVGKGHSWNVFGAVAGNIVAVAAVAANFLWV